MANDRYYGSGQWGINMRNSDIIGVNSIYTNDVSETPGEAILFCRSNGNYDGIRAVNGVLYFSDNVVRTTEKYDAEYKVYHTGNLTKLSQLTNDKNFVTGSVSGQTITINGVSTTWQNTWRGITDSYSGTSTGTSLSQKGANSLYNALHNGYASSAGNADTVDGYHATSGRTFDGNINWSSNWNDAWSDGTNKHPWYGFDHRYPNTGAYSTTITDYFGMTIKTANTLRLDFGTLLLNGTDIHNINVASASKLATARSIWGQSFDGTGNVNGTIYINNSDSENGAIILNNNVNTHARISAIKDQVVFNTGAAIRFGATNWKYSDWAGLKYDTVANAIYLGIADGTVFNYDSNKRSNGTLKFPGITTITPDSGARIGGSGGDLYLGNANNSNWVKVQNICSHNGSNYWYIYQSGNAHFSNINVVGTATIGGDCLVKGGVTAYQSSDIRLKQDLRKLDYLGIIKAMGGTFGFAWKKDNTRSIGWIAQHVLCNPHLKDIVETDEKGYYKINYWSPKLIATAFGAIEQVGDEVSRLKARVVFLESEVQRLSGDKEDCNKKRLDNKNINSLN